MNSSHSASGDNRHRLPDDYDSKSMEGRWLGVHRTINAQNKEVFSWHHYNITTVSLTDGIAHLAGEIRDEIDGDSHPCLAKGEISSFRTTLEAVNANHSSLYKQEIYFDAHSGGKCKKGFIIGYNHNSDLFVARIVMIKRDDEGEISDHLRNSLKKNLSEWEADVRNGPILHPLKMRRGLSKTGVTILCASFVPVGYVLAKVVELIFG